ncbi:MAG TPA: OmpA family protein, partial [Polyangium sp.]|nr:OmpA family protein [Polyangium sp.]
NMRTNSTSRRLLAGAVTTLLLTMASMGAAQESTNTPSLALGRFHPSQAGDRLFGVQSPFVAGHMTPHAVLMFDYAHNPLVLRQANKDAIGSIVSNQMFVHVNATFAMWNRVQLNVNLPLAVVQSGDKPSGDGRTFESPSGFALGDVRIGARVRLLGNYYDALQLGIGGYVWVPTGSGNFVTDGSIRGLPQVIVGGRIGQHMYSLAVGPELRSSQNLYGAVQQGSMIAGGLGYAMFLGAEEQIQIGAEATFSTVLAGDGPSQYNTNAEVLVGGRYRFLKVLEVGIGAGPGLTGGVGTPDVRVVGTFSYSPPVPKGVDSDGDGIFDAQDKCPMLPGIPSSDPLKHGCPPDKDGDGIFDAQDSCVDVPGVPSEIKAKHGCPPDRDGDGIIDVKDACVDVPGVAHQEPTKNGCPPDKDGDGILDPQDACIDVPGVASTEAAKNGCPPDTDGDGIIDTDDACPKVPGPKDADPKKNGCQPDKDGDGIPDKEDACITIPGIKTTDAKTNGCPGDTDGDKIRDDKDACPNEKGAADTDPKKNGCPKQVRVSDTEVIILKQVEFDTAKATIRKVSDKLLDEVSAVLKEHPEITKLEVQGHTDDRGSKELNEKLSDDRAKAVMAALIKRGIEADRLTAKGFGPNVPVGDNKTEKGRQANRRVQFVIKEKKPKAPAN